MKIKKLNFIYQTFMICGGGSKPLKETCVFLASNYFCYQVYIGDFNLYIRSYIKISENAQFLNQLR